MRHQIRILIKVFVVLKVPTNTREERFNNLSEFFWLENSPAFGTYEFALGGGGGGRFAPPPIEPPDTKPANVGRLFAGIL